MAGSADGPGCLCDAGEGKKQVKGSSQEGATFHVARYDNLAEGKNPPTAALKVILFEMCSAEMCIFMRD